MPQFQEGILAPLPNLSRYLLFSLAPDADPRTALQALADKVDPAQTVVGIGLSTIKALESHVAGLGDFPQYSGSGFEVPATPAALWCWLKGEDRGELLHRSRSLEAVLDSAFVLDDVVDGFMYVDSRDLSGYVDGTENPTGEEAVAAAIASGEGGTVAGSSYVAVQQWVHDLDYFLALPENERDNVFGRHATDNEEFEEAPASAHVKRTAQESFSPEAFVVRRSMPWAEGQQAGLMFVAFGKSTDAFEALLRRMVGEEDGVSDALFRFTRPISGSYFWCPPTDGGRLSLAALGL